MKGYYGEYTLLSSLSHFVGKKSHFIGKFQSGSTYVFGDMTISCELN